MTLSRTKHIDIKYHHVQDIIVVEELKIIFIRSENNPVVILTKDIQGEIHGRLSKHVLGRTIFRLLGCGNGEGIKNIYSSHKDCGLNCSPISQIVHCQTNQLAIIRLDIDNFSGRKIPVSEQNFDKTQRIFM